MWLWLMMLGLALGFGVSQLYWLGWRFSEWSGARVSASLFFFPWAAFWSWWLCMRLLKGFACVYSMHGFALWWSVFNNAVLVFGNLRRLLPAFLHSHFFIESFLALRPIINHPDVCMFSYGCLPCFVPLPSNLLSFKYLYASEIQYSSAAVQFFNFWSFCTLVNQ